jgi:hypothetical protein
LAEHHTFEANCKFAVLAAQNVRVDTPPALALQGGTRVLRNFPFQLDAHWKDWLGALQVSSLQACNLFLVCTAIQGWSDGGLEIIGDQVGEALQGRVGGVFAMLRLLGTIEYEGAFVLAGHVANGTPTCRQFATTQLFNVTRGYLPWVIREKDLCTAAELHNSYLSLLERFPDRWRFGRGCSALKSALEQYYASDRLHGFVRALEALILPEIGSTERQFVSRCALFAGPKSAARSIRAVLQEVYRMRCDIEHVHGWDRSLQGYTPAEREDVALWRTRQMEELACAAYRKILLSTDLQQHFHSDAAAQAFWGRPENEIRVAFGNVCDISQLRIVKKYSHGRADPSEWPPKLFEDLRQREKSA